MSYTLTFCIFASQKKAALFPEIGKRAVYGLQTTLEWGRRHGLALTRKAIGNNGNYYNERILCEDNEAQR